MKETCQGGCHCGAVRCLDEPAPEDFAAVAISCDDGRHDDWSKALTETRHL